MSTPRQKAYQAAAQRGMTITENRENRGITIRVEAPPGHNLGSEHEIVTHWYSGSDWPAIIKDITALPVYPCDAACEWWATDDH
jgi:hypothetical protein